ncbi:MAG TPA: methyltransferase domain-containing protein [Bacillales bacterium]
MQNDFDSLIDQAEAPFSGWDFSFVGDTGRMASEPLSWSYASEVLPKIGQAERLLDMGTGGGELLSMLRPLPDYTMATEAYAPNVPVARKQLEPLGVRVFEFENDENLPFADEDFDLIINKHEAYSVKELWRILRTGGQFVTQQVGGTDNAGLNAALGADEDFGFGHWHLDFAEKELASQGFKITKRTEAFPKTRFYDVGAIVYYLKAIPWQIQDFSVEKYRDPLMQIHKQIKETGYVEFSSDRFFLSAEKQ